MVDKLLKFVTSLRLTVACLAFALVLVFVGTLAQVDEGLYYTQERYFKSFLIFYNLTSSGWSIPILPGGYLIGTVLMINLLAAHAKRFKLTKKKAGIFLIHVGLILLLFGQLFTDILSRESSMLIAEGETKNYSEDFRKNELVLIDSTDPSGDTIYSIPESLLAQTGDVTDSRLPFKLRVKHYWPNCQLNYVAPEGAVPIDANQGNYTNHLVYPIPPSSSSQREPAVLVEATANGVSLGTWLVDTQPPNEAMMPEFEQVIQHDGKIWRLSMLYAPFFGGHSLIVSDKSKPGMEGMVAFEESDLLEQTELQNDALPFKLTKKDYWEHCRIYNRPTDRAVTPEVTHGRFTNLFVEPRPLVTDMDNRNLPAAVVEVLDDSSSLGTWLLTTATSATQHLHLPDGEFDLAFRFKRYYEDFSLTLLKASHDVYKGTETPKNFSSRVILDNPKKGENREVLIYMNHPLRYQGLTFFQYQMAAGELAQQRGLTPTSTFQVVMNPTWLTPYLACLMVGAGLLIQFLTHLIGFTRKRKKDAQTPKPPRAERRRKKTGPKDSKSGSRPHAHGKAKSEVAPTMQRKLS